MKTSMIYFGIFTAGLLTGMQVNWESWFWGLAAGVSVCRIIFHVMKEDDNNE